jgi:membrane-bound ClpP family serine protease
MLLLFQPAGSGYQVSLWVSLAVALTVSAFFAFALAKVIQVRRRPPSVAPQAIVGAHGEVRTSGLVAVNGELWKARMENGEWLARGGDVEVVALDGLELVVRPVRTPSPV